jgi:hypothetical protein
LRRPASLSILRARKVIHLLSFPLVPNLASRGPGAPSRTHLPLSFLFERTNSTAASMAGSATPSSSSVDVISIASSKYVRGAKSLVGLVFFVVIGLPGSWLL